MDEPLIPDAVRQYVLGHVDKLRVQVELLEDEVNANRTNMAKLNRRFDAMEMQNDLNHQELVQRVQEMIDKVEPMLPSAELMHDVRTLVSSVKESKSLLRRAVIHTAIYAPIAAVCVTVAGAAWDAAKAWWKLRAG